MKQKFPFFLFENFKWIINLRNNFRLFILARFCPAGISYLPVYQKTDFSVPQNIIRYRHVFKDHFNLSWAITSFVMFDGKHSHVNNNSFPPPSRNLLLLNNFKHSTLNNDRGEGGIYSLQKRHAHENSGAGGFYGEKADHSSNTKSQQKSELDLPCYPKTWILNWVSSDLHWAQSAKPHLYRIPTFRSTIDSCALSI